MDGSFSDVRTFLPGSRNCGYPTAQEGLNLA
jgi:hypothetical protein